MTIDQSEQPTGQNAPSLAGSTTRPRPAGTRRRKLNRRQRFWASAWPAAVLVFLFYGVYLLIFFRGHHDPRDFIHIENYYIHLSHVSPTIKVDPNYKGYLYSGYDGQFFYFIALDPVNARYYIDAPAYRYTRILYPLTARLLALGIPQLLPYTLILINWLSLVGGTLALGAWLKRKGYSHWFALVFGFYPGLFIAFQNDVSEPMAYALVAWGIYLFDFGGRRRLLWSSIVFALAALTRETTIVFPILYGLAVLLGSKDLGAWRARLAAGWRRAILLLAVSLGPFLLYKGFLALWLGEIGISGREVGASRDVALGFIPFQGITDLWPWTGDVWAAIVCIIAPALLVAGVALWGVLKKVQRVELWVLLVNVVAFVILLGSKAYVDFTASERVTVGVVLAALFCLPAFDGITGRSRWWFWASLLLWETAILLKITHSLIGFPQL
jgi:hypothetical protein